MELLAGFALFIFLVIFLHVILVFKFQIGSEAWKWWDYAWYIPAVVGIVFAYNDVIEKDISARSSDLLNQISLGTNRLSRIVESYISSSCPSDQVRPFENIEAAEKSYDPFVLPPPSTSAPEKNLETFFGSSFEPLFECVDLRAIRTSLLIWRDFSDWPLNTIPLVAIDINPGTPSHQMDIESSFSKVQDLLQNFEIGAGKIFVLQPLISLAEEIDGQILALSEIRSQLESQSIFTPLWRYWYFALAFAAAIRITKVAGEIRIERQKRTRKRGKTESS